MKKITCSPKYVFLLLLFTSIAIAFQSCYNDENKDDLTPNIELSATGGAACDLTGGPPSSCISESCICPTRFILSDINGENTSISFRRLGGIVAPVCYQIYENGDYCLALEAGGINQSTGTSYLIALNGQVSQSPSATISVIGSCSGDEDIIDLEMVYGTPTGTVIWNQWACLSQGIDQ